ncbi:MAG: M48 family metallopeptidase [Candidatus Pacebacteria bacterium]|nr:M48 family metallopeptidase [Candidatus Paceibacterota bacterium]
MATLYSQADANVRKTWFLMATFFIAVIGIGWALSYAMGNPGILYIAVFISIAMNVGSYWYSDKLALASTGAKPVAKEAAPDLYNIVENLAISEGMPMPKVYVIEDAAPNAFATGRDPKHGVVAVTTGLLAMLDRAELEGVVAHELSHIKNRDTLVMTVVIVLLGFVTLLSDFFLRSMMFGGGQDRDNRLGMIMVVAGIALAILSPFVAQLIQLAISRKREFLADASGALMTRYPEGLASALQKISAYSQPMRTANDATAHLFISSPFGAQSFKGLHKLFMTHPPTEERIRALLGK